MKQRTVLLAGLIGLVFGFLFSATLGIDFFKEDEIINNNDTEERDALKKDEEGFRLAYNLDTSIYVPIYGDDAYEMIENGDTFILYIGRDTCPYCQAYVPQLQTAAQNQSISMIYHVDTVDPENELFVDQEGVVVTPTTYFIKDGVVVEELVGFKTTSELEQLIMDTIK